MTTDSDYHSCYCSSSDSCEHLQPQRWRSARSMKSCLDNSQVDAQLGKPCRSWTSRRLRWLSTLTNEGEVGVVDRSDRKDCSPIVYQLCSTRCLSARILDCFLGTHSLSLSFTTCVPWYHVAWCNVSMSHNATSRPLPPSTCSPICLLQRPFNLHTATHAWHLWVVLARFHLCQGALPPTLTSTIRCLQLIAILDLAIVMLKSPAVESLGSRYVYLSWLSRCHILSSDSIHDWLELLRDRHTVPLICFGDFCLVFRVTVWDWVPAVDVSRSLSIARKTKPWIMYWFAIILFPRLSMEK